MYRCVFFLSVLNVICPWPRRLRKLRMRPVKQGPGETLPLMLWMHAIGMGTQARQQVLVLAWHAYDGMHLCIP